MSITQILKEFRLRPTLRSRNWPVAYRRVAVAIAQDGQHYTVIRSQTDSGFHGAAWEQRKNFFIRQSADIEYRKACKEARKAFPHYEVY